MLLGTSAATVLLHLLQTFPHNCCPLHNISWIDPLVEAVILILLILPAQFDAIERSKKQMRFLQFRGF